MDLLKYQNLISDNPCYLATVTSTDELKPNLSVVEDIRVLEGDKIIISHNEMRQTIVNLHCNPNLVIATLNNERRGVRLTGTAEYFTEGKYFQKCLELFKNTETHPRGVLIFTVDKVEEMA